MKREIETAKTTGTSPPSLVGSIELTPQAKRKLAYITAKLSEDLGFAPEPRPISETTYVSALDHAARILIDKEDADFTGRKLGYDLNAALQSGLSKPGLALQKAAGKPRSMCTKEDLRALALASTFVVDYLMLTATIAEQRGEA